MRVGHWQLLVQAASSGPRHLASGPFLVHSHVPTDDVTPEDLELWHILKALPPPGVTACSMWRSSSCLDMVWRTSGGPHHGHSECRHVEVTHLPTNVCHIFGCYTWINKRAGFHRILQLQQALNPPLYPPQTLSRTHAAHEVSARQLAVVSWAAELTLIPLPVLNFVQLQAPRPDFACGSLAMQLLWLQSALPALGPESNIAGPDCHALLRQAGPAGANWHDIA